MKREIVWTWAAEADMQRFYAEAEDQEEGKGLELLTLAEKATVLLLCFPQMASSCAPTDFTPPPSGLILCT